MKNLKNTIVNSAKNQFAKIPKIIQIVEYRVNYGWLEIHYCNTQCGSLKDFILSSLRHVHFWQYGIDDQHEFENDISKGKFIQIKNEELKDKLILHGGQEKVGTFLKEVNF